ncbi:uncharacterized protein BDCG_08766 [Blastomyces dermatitidis ER-3]|uniref:MFS multidrug transporter n=2 Tax=Blastomyces TaxID=229219 RepID=A0A179UXN3_BLAGS|nr:uncharacterized protein BDBG_07389 [Blastomyces gilchristii SLH14081]XP_045273238.1 uncharacterized protein BDCG_08766 [Blastomyces dermatitidis ER-3]EEQ85497.2 hypothetical protein BDCG_08766 [Blastomyces dermatitidis ER-3]OAT11979.1 hypothetical protein BDBG_07389 [Blastomyces gilchristii SLH14081]
MAADSDHTFNETDTLLGTDSRPPPARPRVFRSKPVVFVFLCVFIVFFIDSGAYLSIAPLARICEAIAHRTYYEKRDPGRYRLLEEIPEEKCKISPVQSELAFVQGLQISFEALPTDLLSAWVHFWTFMGILLSVPYGRLADNVRYGRKFTLALAVAGLLLGQLWVIMVCWFAQVMPLRSVWLGSAALLLGGGTGIAITMLMTMITDIVETRSSKHLSIMLLYVSTRYSIPLSTANFSLTIFAGVNIFLLLVFLPTVSRYLTLNRRYSTTTKDLILSRYSITMYTIGALFLGLAPTIATMITGLVIFTLGSGFNSLNLSLVATYVEPQHIARLYSVVLPDNTSDGDDENGHTEDEERGVETSSSSSTSSYTDN